jgi:tetratricopeptide (TPR) repeat protein
VQILKEEGNLLFKHKQYTSAARKYYEALDRVSHNHGDHDRSGSFGQIQDALCVSIAQAQYFSGKYEEVIQHCRRYCKDNAKMKFWHALSLYEIQQYEKSIALMKEAIKLEPNNSMLIEKLKEIKFKYQETLSEQSTAHQPEHKDSSKGKIVKWALVGLALAGIGLGIYYIKKRRGA